MRDTDEPIAAEVSCGASDGAAAGRVADIVAAHLMPVTRFERADIRHQGEEQAIALALTLEVRHGVAFAAEHHAGPGRLPDGIAALGGAFAVSTHIHQALSLAGKQVGDALRAWAESEPDGYRRVLPADAAFKKPPVSYGHEFTCSSCVGQQQVVCPGCGGAGQNPCQPCASSGKIDCPCCHGAKHLNCVACCGRGSWTESVTTPRWDAAHNEQVTDYTSVHHSCAACGASGQTSCDSCDYAGKISCAACHGQGHNGCDPCQATGKVDCEACLASGVQHAWSAVRASVEHSETLEIHSQDEALRALVEQRIARADLPAFGALLDVRHSVVDGAIDSRYRLRLDVIKAPLGAARRDFVVYGFGPGPTVFDFANIAGHLLEDDLVDLERSSEEALCWRRQRRAALLKSAQRFVESELNLLVAEQLTDQCVTMAQASYKVEQQFHGLVDATYVKRASCSLRLAFGRLYGVRLAEPVLYQGLLVFLLTALMFGAGWPRPGVWPAAACGLGLALLSWGGLEWATQRHIRRSFPGQIGERVVQQLKAACTIKRWRMNMLATSAVLVFGAVGLTAQLPWVARAHQAQREAAHIDAALTRWATQPVADLRQRSYPPTDLLTQFAERGDPRAQLVLVWQLLLGTGTDKDMEEAAQWLGKAPASLDADPLWRSARAVLVLNQGRPLGEVRAACQQLEQAAGQGLAEARYREARCYLDEQSPLRGAKPGADKIGTEKLIQAADAGHAHAALDVAKLYGRGRNGLRRDMGKAKHYLAIARDGGLGANLL